MPPCEITDYTFPKTKGVTLYVPKELIEAYRQAPIWKEFNIQEATGVSHISANTPQPTKRYQLDGRPATNHRGVVITRMSDGSIRKTLE